MAEYRYVSLPSEGTPFKTEDREVKASEELNELAAEGWIPISVTRPTPISPIGFLLRRD